MNITKKRNSNIELLRIICMILLVMHHFLVHGGLIGMPSSTNKIITYALVPTGKICFNTFVAISCWFLTKSTFKGARFMKVWLQVLFYNIVFSWVAICMNTPEYPVGINSFIGALFPMTGNSHGYAAAYLWFYLLTPLLKKLTHSLSKRGVLYILFILAATQIFVPLIGHYTHWTQYLQSEMLLFVFIYFAAYYMQNWPLRFQNNKAILLLIFVLSAGAAMFANIALALNYSNTLINWLQRCANNEFSPLYIIAGFSLFLIFFHLRIPQMKVVNSVATTTFGILLFHDHNILRPFVWLYIKNLQVWETLSVGIFLGYIAGITAVVFLCGMIIDYLRQKLIEKVLIEDSMIQKIGCFLDKVASDFTSDSKQTDSNQ